MNTLERVIERVGGRRRMAKLAGVSVEAVRRWLLVGQVGLERSLKIETATKGEISRYELRPDAFGSKPSRCPHCGKAIDQPIRKRIGHARSAA